MPSRPLVPKVLGFAGLLPQVAAVVVLALGPETWHFSALALAYAYAALILSFLGGMWWGLAAAAGDETPAWIWVAAVAPSIIALATALPWAIGAAWPGPSLVILGVAVLASLLIDRRLRAKGLTPAWWMSLRAPLSAGLGAVTLAAAALG
jgi:hypothetical protein